MYCNHHCKLCNSHYDLHFTHEETKDQGVLGRLFVLTKLVNSFIETQRMGFLVAVFPAKPKNEIVKNQA